MGGIASLIDEVMSLRSEVEALRTALRPFVDAAILYEKKLANCDPSDDAFVSDNTLGIGDLRVGALRRAYEAYTRVGAPERDLNEAGGTPQP